MSTHLFLSLTDLCNAFGLAFTLPFWHSPRTVSCGLTLFPFPYASFLFVFAFLRLTSKHRLFAKRSIVLHSFLFCVPSAPPFAVWFTLVHLFQTWTLFVAVLGELVVSRHFRPVIVFRSTRPFFRLSLIGVGCRLFLSYAHRNSHSVPWLLSIMSRFILFSPSAQCLRTSYTAKLSVPSFSRRLFDWASSRFAMTTSSADDLQINLFSLLLVARLAVIFISHRGYTRHSAKVQAFYIAV